MNKPLYDIKERYQNLWELCLDDNVDLDVLENALKTVEGELNDKVQNGIALIQSLKILADGMDAEAKRLAAKKRAIDNNIDRIKNYYLDNLKLMGKTKVATSLGTMTVAKSGGLKPLIIDDESLIPADFKRVVSKVEIDKDLIRATLNAGEEVDGAYLGERKFYLKIS